MALVKYWPKARGLDKELNIPAADSVGVTLKGIDSPLRTTTTIEFKEGYKEDKAILVTKKGKRELKEDRVLKVIEPLRRKAGTDLRFKMVSKNSFPHKAGLASSSSAFSALAWATIKALGLKINKERASTFARLGSGSAARAVFGNYVYWHSSEESQGSFAEPVDSNLDMQIVIASISEEEKAIGSEAGHETAWKSPLTNKFVKETKKQSEKLVKSIKANKFDSVGQITEKNFKLMHSVITTSLGFVYLKPKSLRALRAIRRARKQGINCYYTLDAGPNVFCICKPEDVDKIIEVMEERRMESIVAKPGGGAKSVGNHLF